MTLLERPDSCARAPLSLSLSLSLALSQSLSLTHSLDLTQPCALLSVSITVLAISVSSRVEYARALGSRIPSRGDLSFCTEVWWAVFSPHVVCPRHLQAT